MPTLERAKVANASEVDSMIGTSNWTIYGQGSFGQLSHLNIQWIEGTHHGFPVCKQSGVVFRELTRGKNPDDLRINEDSSVHYSRSIVSGSDLFTIDLMVSIDALEVLTSFVRVPKGVICKYSKKQRSHSDFNYYYYKVSSWSLFVGRLFGKRAVDYFISEDLFGTRGRSHTSNRGKKLR